MFGKKSGYFLLLLLLLDPSRELLADKGNGSLEELEKLLKQGNVSQQLVLETAKVLLCIPEENPDAEKVLECPSIKEFIQQLIQKGPKLLTAANRAYFGATVYLGFVNLIIEGEVKPILDYVNMKTSLNGDEENSLTNICDTELMKVMEMLKERRLKTQNIVHDFKNLKELSRKGFNESRELNKIFSYAALAFVLPVVIGTPMTLSRFYVLPLAVACGFVGYHYGEGVRAYEQTLKLLEKIENKAFEAEKEITKLQTKVQLACPAETTTKLKEEKQKQESTD